MSRRRLSSPPLTGDRHGRRHPHADHDSRSARTSRVNDPDTRRPEYVLWRARTDGRGCLLRTRCGGEVQRRRRLRLRFHPGNGSTGGQDDRMLWVILFSSPTSEIDTLCPRVAPPPNTNRWRTSVIAFKVVGEPRPRVVWGLGPEGGEPVPLMATRRRHWGIFGTGWGNLASLA